MTHFIVYNCANFRKSDHCAAWNFKQAGIGGAK